MAIHRHTIYQGPSNSSARGFESTLSFCLRRSEVKFQAPGPGFDTSRPFPHKGVILIHPRRIIVPSGRPPRDALQ